MSASPKAGLTGQFDQRRNWEEIPVGIAIAIGIEVLILIISILDTDSDGDSDSEEKLRSFIRGAGCQATQNPQTET